MSPPRAAILVAAVAIGAAVVGLLTQAPVVPGVPGASGLPVGPGAGAVDPVPWNGVNWRKRLEPFAVGDPVPMRIDGLVAGNGLVVGWGRVSVPRRNQFNDMGAVFVTRDGENWRSIALDNGVGPEHTSEPFGVSIGPLGMLAHGGVCCASEERAFWLSADGIRWTRLEIEGDLDAKDAWVARVVGLPEGWVAVGSSGGRAAIWSSADARTWRAVDPGQAGLGPGSISDVAVAGDRLIAVGTIDDEARTHDGGVWASDDGIQWSRVAAADPTLIGPDETEPWRIVPFARGLLMTGNHGPHEERVRCEQLLGAVASLAAEPPPETALSCGWGREHHWVSPDGSAWLRLPPRDPLPGLPAGPEVRPIEFRLIGAGGPGLVNLGEDTRAPDGDSAVWVSADGGAWRPVDPVGPLKPAAGTPAFVLVGRTIIAVAEADGAKQLRPEWGIADEELQAILSAHASATAR